MQKTNNYGGLKAKRNGEQFEMLIERTCAYYSKMGKAHIQKTPEPMKVLTNLGRGQFKSVFTKKAQPDFTGTLKSGKSIVFEAKHTEGTRISFDRINEVQAHDLEVHMQLGAKVFVLISFKSKWFYAVPWDKWIDMKNNIGKKSVNQEDLDEYHVSTEKGYLEFI
ncbi:hypothetical protein BKP56_07090 [Marinilactibacillus sp. 15R]|uniref:Holliday junction resolvase RecU n=1 Tax=Marinilactibacillus sp. 15R TaxID=1911586 RepID=UPI00090A92CD|nr:Holliday junction resolvase RecU [Marinilactibacillus sp. 15R]API89033.1 hypothetical protein BKP56_07090 [Marinilactibacillus sp. 15R]